jgi:hypothetical protein
MVDSTSAETERGRFFVEQVGMFRDVRQQSPQGEPDAGGVVKFATDALDRSKPRVASSGIGRSGEGNREYPLRPLARLAAA